MHKPVTAELSVTAVLPAAVLPAAVLPAVILLSVLLITACSKQSWYAGAQSAQQAHCMKQPISEYEDCMQQTSDSYNEFEIKRQDVLGTDKK